MIFCIGDELVLSLVTEKSMLDHNFGTEQPQNITHEAYKTQVEIKVDVNHKKYGFHCNLILKFLFICIELPSLKQTKQNVYTNITKNNVWPHQRTATRRKIDGVEM
jgi:hypothetical protein